jgi:hypothetical protein
MSSILVVDDNVDTDMVMIRSFKTTSPFTASILGDITKYMMSNKICIAVRGITLFPF